MSVTFRWDDDQDESRLTQRHGSIITVNKLVARDDSYIRLKPYGEQPSTQHEPHANKKVHLPYKHRANTIIKHVSVRHTTLK